MIQGKRGAISGQRYPQIPNLFFLLKDMTEEVAGYNIYIIWYDVENKQTNYLVLPHKGEASDHQASGTVGS